MTSARTAFEAARRTAQELADAAQAEAKTPGLDEVAKAEAFARYTAYQALANVMTEQQSKGFTDPDPVVNAERAAEVHAQIEQAQRSRRLRERVAHLADAHDAIFTPIITQYGEIGLVRIAQAYPTVAYLSVMWRALQAIVSEWTPEQQAVTEEAIEGVRKALEPLKGIGFDPKSPGRMVQ